MKNHRGVLLTGVATIMLAGLLTPQTAWAIVPCTPDSSPSSNCVGLDIDNPNLTIAIPSTVTVDGSGNQAVANNATGTFFTNEGNIITTIPNGLNNQGTMTSLVNNGSISGDYFGIENGGTITTLTNGGSITGSSIGSIDNNGTITTFNNKQGVGGSGPVNIYGTAPINYNIIIASPTTYGQVDIGGGINGTMHFGVYAGSTVATGVTYSSVLIGADPSTLTVTSGTYNGYDWLLTEVGTSLVWDLTFSIGSGPTLDEEQAATQTLSDNQHAMLINSRSTANEILGFTRAIDKNTYTYAGGMFGSAVGYAGGQISGHGVTVLGGLTYGDQDYGDNISQDAAGTIALAARYTFHDAFSQPKNLHPFVELGGWVTPNAKLSFTRPYLNAGTPQSGNGSTDSTNWSEYLRLGLTADVNSNNSVTGFGDIGQQVLNFDGYTETAAASNPFPATIDAGTLRMNVLRGGGSWTSKLGDLSFGEGAHANAFPIELTLAGAIAHSFDVHSGLTSTAGSVTTKAFNDSDTWGEFGARIEAQVAPRTSVSGDISGTTGSGAIGTSVHGGVSLKYRF